MCPKCLAISEIARGFIGLAAAFAFACWMKFPHMTFERGDILKGNVAEVAGIGRHERYGVSRALGDSDEEALRQPGLRAAVIYD